MAANTNLLTDKETINWFKASIALNVTKQGLTHFLDTELQNVHCVVGRICGNCPIENLLPGHKSQKPQPCPTCDKVKQNIISQHRYGRPSWRNTRAEKWALDYWEIGKCYLPPDGYSSVSSVQESDFNGVISIMLNCLHFQTCLSSSCLSPPPPDKQCLLEKVRQIGRDVRHTANCNVTDADLQDYFKTLSTLLADPNGLQNDHAATAACTRLSDLQNNRMSMKELRELLQEAYQTLKHAKEAGERISEEAERTLAKVLDDAIQFGEQRIRKKTQAGEHRLKSQTHAGQQRLINRTKVAEQRLESKVHFGEERLERKAQSGEDCIESKIQRGEERLKSKAKSGKERIESKANIGEDRIESKTKRGEERIEGKRQCGEECIESKAKIGEERIESKAQRGEERIESRANIGEERLESKTQRGEERIESKAHIIEENIEKKAQRGEERIESKTQHGEERIESKTKRGEERIESKANIEEERLQSKAQRGEERLVSKTQRGEERLESKGNIEEERLESKAQRGEERLESKTQRGEERLESKANIGEVRFESKANIREERLERMLQRGEERTEIQTQFGEQRIESKIHDAEQCLEHKIQDGAQRIENSVQDGIIRMQHATNTTAQVDYERGKKDLRGRLVEHYNDHSSNVPISILDQSLDKRITDIYATPKIHRIEIAKDGKREKKEQVWTYKEIFYTDDNKSNRRIFVQGEPGSGKSTFAAKLVHDWCDGNPPSVDASTKNKAFDDVIIIRNFKFIFFISLRESRGQTDVTHMIQKQLIDTMYSGQKRDALYKLLHQIIETEFCLVVRDGLDEWVAPDGSNMAEPSMAGFPNDKCTVLTTSRPWKLANERIKNSQVDILLEMDGIDDPDAFSERILRCILDDSKDLKTTAMDIRNFISVCKLTELSYSPMWYTLVTCTWVNKMEEEEHLKGSSLCALWTTLLESLCKKANDTTGYFNDLIPPPVKCFASTSYLQPIIQIINVMSKAAFHLLFSPEQETSIVFNDHILSNYVSKSEREFALKAGILSQRKTKNISNASISFLHKSMQEFLAAYYIARNAYLIDDVISGHFNRHKEAYLDISLLFIFLCGLNITAANKLSGMMDEQNDRMVNEYCGTFDLYKVLTFDGIQGIIAPGYREAVLNEQTNIRLRLSYFIVNGNNLRDIYNIWKENTSNALALDMTNDTDSHSSPAHRDQTCPVEFDLSSCIKLKVLRLEGCCIKDSASSVSFAYQVYIVQNSADPSQYDGPLQSLPSIEYIRLQSVTCSCTWLRSLFSTLQKLDHEVECRLMECNITSYVEGAVSGPDIKTGAILKFLKNKSNMLEINKESLSLWKAVHGMNIKNLRLQGVNVNHTESMLQSLSSFTQLETLSVHMCHNSPNLWKGIRGLNIKSLSLSGLLGLMDVNQVESLSQSLCSFKHLETLSIGMCNNSPNLWKCVRGLNIKSLSLNGLSGLMDVNHVELLSQSLCSFKHLETLSITTFNESPDLWKGLRCLNIKSLNLTGCLRRMNLNNVELLLQSLSSLKQLETLSIEMYDDKPGLWEGQGLQGLNIKSLSLSSWWGTMKGNSAELLLHSSLLNEAYNNNSNIWKGLHGLNIKNLSLSGDLVWLHVYHIESMLQSLSSFSHLETLSIDLHYANSELWQVLRDLNITNDQCGWLTVNPGGSLSHSLSSLKQLETLTIYVRTFFDIQLPQSLKYLNVYCFALLPSELRKLVDTLSARTCTIEIKLEFGCASFKDFRVKPIPPAKYISVQQELETLKNVAVKRFLLLNRICETEIYDDLESAWSACGICCVDAHNQDDDNVAEKAYKCFMRNYDNEIINRISMRFLINPA